MHSRARFSGQLVIMGPSLAPLEYRNSGKEWIATLMLVIPDSSTGSLFYSRDPSEWLSILGSLKSEKSLIKIFHRDASVDNSKLTKTLLQTLRQALVFDVYCLHARQTPSMVHLTLDSLEGNRSFPSNFVRFHPFNHVRNFFMAVSSPQMNLLSLIAYHFTFSWIISLIGTGRSKIEH